MVLFSHLAATAAALAAQAVAAPTNQARDSLSAQFVEGGYIVRFKPGVADADVHLNWVQGLHARSLAKRDLPGVERKFNLDTFLGYAGRFDEDTIAQIENSEDVAYVEKDQVYHIEFNPTQPTEKTRRDLTSQDPAPWGLAAISHRKPNASTAYVYDAAAGKDTYAYVLDTGIRTTHEDFEGRAESGWSAYDGQNGDGQGHGTHVAGTIGGKTFGVAKKASLIAVKVLDDDGYGSTSAILDGVQWAVDDISSKGRKDKAVLNLSLGGPSQQSLNDIIEAAYQKGVLSVVAAGNEKQDASNVSPASSPNAITVGAITSEWKIADHWVVPGTGEIVGSNYGKVLDIFAPGDNIESATNRNDTGSVVYRGTSQAAPHVAGLVLYANSVYGIKGAKEVTEYIIGLGGKGVVGGELHGSPNLLANNGNADE